MENTAPHSAYASGTTGLDAFVLKVAAIVAMTSDHIGIVFWGQLPDWARIALFAPGGLTFPVLACLLTVGYRHTRDVRIYALRLLGFAAVAQIPYHFMISGSLNVLFTLLLGLGVLCLYDRVKNRAVFAVAFVGAVFLSGYCDWAYVGVPMILLYRVVEQRPWCFVLPALLVGALMLFNIFASLFSGTLGVHALAQLAYAAVGTTLSVPLLLRYNGQRGRSLKYFFYAYYPAHLAVLVVLRGVLVGTW
ncbi:MAG: conjugal transfer protein TraX [Coriobacteriales bacterium]|jgi:hypothetical protein|nr:conjugal transfer protein TraX [Coriobacteriales bacterium]